MYIYIVGWGRVYIETAFGDTKSARISSPMAKAMGIDLDLPGYEKDGVEIQRLKVNGNLALFFFVNEDQNDLPETHDA
jgi:hypothetical protein